MDSGFIWKYLSKILECCHSLIIVTEAMINIKHKVCIVFGSIIKSHNCLEPQVGNCLQARLMCLPYAI